MKDLTNKFFNGIKKVIATGAAILTPYFVSGQETLSGNKFTITGDDGEIYNVESVAMHATPLYMKEVEKTENNPLGSEIYPVKFIEVKSKKLIPSAVYVPERMEENRIVFKQDGPFGMSSDISQMDYSKLNLENAMGEVTQIKTEDLSKKFYTYVNSSGDTIYYPFNTNANVDKGQELNFVWTFKDGAEIGADKQGNVYIENKENGIYRWVIDPSRTNEQIYTTIADSIVVNDTVPKTTADTIQLGENQIICPINDSLFEVRTKYLRDSSLVTNNFYPDAYLPLSQPTTGEVAKFEYVPTEGKTKKDKEKKERNIDGRIKVGAGITRPQGYVASITPQLKVADNLYLGVEGFYTNSTKKLEEITQEPGFSQLINMPAGIYYTNSGAEVRENTDVQNNFGVGLNASYVLSPSFEVNAKVGTIGQETKYKIQSIGEEHMEIAGEIDPESIHNYNETNTSTTNNPLFKGSPIYIGAGAEYKCNCLPGALKNLSLAGDVGYITGENSGAFGSLKLVYNFLEGKKE